MKKLERIISLSSSIPISSAFVYSCCLLRQEESSSFSLRILPFAFSSLRPIEAKGKIQGSEVRCMIDTFCIIYKIKNNIIKVEQKINYKLIKTY